MAACSQCYPQYIHCYQSTCHYAGKFISPLPVIGTTVAIASLVCTLLIAADIIRSCRANQLWIPCRFFTLSAASLAPLTIAVKLLMDLTNPTPNAAAQLAKLTSTAFLCTSISSIMPSIGPMANVEMVYNVVGLAILIMPTVFNVLIQLFMGTVIVGLVVEHVLITLMLVFTLAVVIFTAVTVPSVRRDVDRRFSGKQGRNVALDGIEEYVEMSWMMAQTGRLEFVVVRLVTSLAASFICLLVFVVMAEAMIRTYIMYPDLDGFTEYRWGSYLILVTQTGGVIIGAVGAALRLSVTYSYPMKCSFGWLRMERYWTRNLERLKRKVLHPKVGSGRGRKALGVILSVLVRLQIILVKASKGVRLVPVFVLDRFFSCYYMCKKPPVEESGLELGSKEGVELRHYAVLLEGEEELPGRVLKDIRESFRDLIDEGRKRKPKHLLEFVKRGNGEPPGVNLSTGLDLQESGKCWSLPVVTLASIYVAALTGPGNPNVDHLVRSVSEGIELARVIEKHIDRDKEFLDRRNAAEVIWTGVEFRGEWLDENLKPMALVGKTCRERLQWLVHVAETKLANEGNGQEIGSYSDKVVMFEAATSLEKIARGVLRDHGDSTNDELSSKLYDAIAEMLRSCLSNLPGAVTAMCTLRTEKSMARAARLVGETEDVVKFLVLKNLD